MADMTVTPDGAFDLSRRFKADMGNVEDMQMIDFRAHALEQFIHAQVAVGADRGRSIASLAAEFERQVLAQLRG